MSNNENINTDICPLCQDENLCGVDNAEGCWCMNKKIPKALTENIPKKLLGKVCICQKCINRYDNKYTSLQ